MSRPWRRQGARLPVFAHDLDFSAILAATGGEKPSVVQASSEDAGPEAIGAVVVADVRQTAGDLDEGALLTWS